MQQAILPAKNILNEKVFNEMIDPPTAASLPMEEGRAHFQQTLQSALANSLHERWWGGVARIFGRLTRQKPSFPFVATVLFLNFFTLAICVVISLLMGESAVLQPINLLPPIAWVGFTALYVLVMHTQLSRTVQILGTTIAESITSAQDLHRFGHVIRRATRFPLQFAFAILFALICGVWIPTVLWQATGAHFLTGVLLLYFVNYFQMAMYIYFLFAFILILLALSNVDLEIYANDPSNSPVIRRIYNASTTLTLCVAALSALHYFLVSVLGFDIASPVTWITLIVLAWVPPLGLFIATNYSLSQIMGRAKSRKLAQIQQSIEQMETTNDFPPVESLDTIQRLMDYHDRIRATPNSLVNFSSLSGLVGSLLLPLIGTILGNLDTIIGFFR